MVLFSWSSQLGGEPAGSVALLAQAERSEIPARKRRIREHSEQKRGPVGATKYRHAFTEVRPELTLTFPSFHAIFPHYD